MIDPADTLAARADSYRVTVTRESAATRATRTTEARPARWHWIVRSVWISGDRVGAGTVAGGWCYGTRQEAMAAGHEAVREQQANAEERIRRAREAA